MTNTWLGSCLVSTALILLAPAQPATAQISVGIGLPTVSIGVHLPVYPQLVLVPGYPVYYAPDLRANYFFYDGMYWVYERDRWYASSWYDGPWAIVAPAYVPVFILRVPVRYYRQPPRYFYAWRADRPPRWSEHWGRDWERQRSGWDRWDRGSAPRAAPLPVYQRQYAGKRYPRHFEEQVTVRAEHYRYQPREPVVRQHYQARRREPKRAAQPERQAPQRLSTQQPARPRPESQRAEAPNRGPQAAPRKASAQQQPKAQGAPRKEVGRHDDPKQREAQKRPAKDADQGAEHGSNGGKGRGAPY